MNGWKLVPVEPTPEMLTALYLDSDEHGFARADYALMLAAAPKWEPSDEDVQAAAIAISVSLKGTPDYGRSYMAAARAALKAALGGDK